MNSRKKRSKKKVQKDDEAEMSGYETHFVPHESDDEEDRMWAVEEILAENHGFYLLRWVGLDESGQPWPDSWVAKHDVTDDLIAEWKARKRRQQEAGQSKEQKRKRSSKDRESLSRKSSVTASSAGTVKRKHSDVADLGQREDTPAGSSRTLSSQDARSSMKKRKRQATRKVLEGDEVEREEEVDEERTSVQLRPKKRPRSMDKYDKSVSPVQQQAKRSKQTDTSSKGDDNTSSVEVEQTSKRQRRGTPDSTTSQKLLEKKHKRKSVAELAGPRHAAYSRRRSSADSVGCGVEEEEGGPVSSEGREERPEDDGEEGEEAIVEKESVDEDEDSVEHVPVVKRRRRTRTSTTLRTIAGSSSLPTKVSVDVPSPSILAEYASSRHSKRCDKSQSSVDFGVEHGDNFDSSFFDDQPRSQQDGSIESPLYRLPASPSQRGHATLDSSYTGTIIPETQSSKHDSTRAEIATSSQIQDADLLNFVEQSEHQNSTIEPLTSSQMFVPSKTLLQPMPMVTSKFKSVLSALGHTPQIPPDELRRVINESTRNPERPVLTSSIDTEFKSDNQRRTKTKLNSEPIDDDIVEDSIDPSITTRANNLKAADENLSQFRKTTHLLLDDGIEHSLDVDNTQTEDRTVPAPIPTSEEEAMFKSFVDSEGGAGNGAHDMTADDTEAHSIGNKPGETGDDGAMLDNEDGESSMQFGGTDVMNDPYDPNADGIIRRPHTPTSATSRGEDTDDHLLATPGKFTGVRELPDQHGTNEGNQTFETPTRQLNSALGLLNKKSEEITDLKGERQTLLERVAELESTLAVQAVRLAESSNSHQRAEETTDGVLSVQISEMKQQLDELVAERDSLKQELDLVKIARDSARDSAKDTEKDVELFKGLYNKASTFASEQLKENDDLKERVTIAERQVSAGLDLIRKTYESRNLKLTEECTKATTRLKLLETRAERTDDDVRKRAQLFYEQQGEIARLEDRIESLKDDRKSLKREREDLLVNLRNLEEERHSWTIERSNMDFELRRMRVELAKFAARERSVKQAWDLSVLNDGDIDPPVEEDPDEEEVYVCRWVVNDSGEWCGTLLPTQQELQDHLFVAGHL